MTIRHPSPPSGCEPIYSLDQVTKVYRRRTGELRAVDGASFDLYPQQRLGIVGESGSGKSTLIKMMAALIRPTCGTITFDGDPIDSRDRLTLYHLRRNVQMIFQDPRSSLDPRMKIKDTICEPLTSPIWESRSYDHTTRLNEVLRQVGLPTEVADRYPHQFSGGQRQRIAIARAIVAKPQVLIADEAVSALDVSVRAHVLNLLGSLIDEYGLTMIFVSHDLSVIRHICDSVMVLYQGKIVEYGTVEQIYSDPTHPYTQQLLRSIPRLIR